MLTILRAMGRLILEIALRLTNTLLVLITLGAVIAYANYAVTVGSGTNFGSLVISSVHYATQLICDATNGQSNCAAVKAGNTSVVADQAVVVTDPNVLAAVQGAVPTCGANPCTNAIGVIDQRSQYPAGATAITISATGTTGATTATLAGTSGKTTYICGFSIRANATAAATGNATITGTITGTLNFTQWTAPNASGLGINEQIFAPCVPASASNTGIAVISAAPGTGGVVSSTAWGYQL